MGIQKYFDEMIERRLLTLNTAYLAKVLKVNGSTVKIQPLGLTKEVNQKGVKQSILSAVPYLEHIEELKKNDIVLVVCCQRNISEAKNGKNVVPPAGHHKMSDSVIVGVLKE